MDLYSWKNGLELFVAHSRQKKKKRLYVPPGKFTIPPATAAAPTITRRNGVNTAVSKNSISKSYKNTDQNDWLHTVGKRTNQENILKTYWKHYPVQL